MAPRGRATPCSTTAGSGRDFLDFTVDRNPYKQGKFLPGTHIPIYGPEEIDRRRPDYVFILPWNVKDEIVAQLSHIRGLGWSVYRPDPLGHGASVIFEPTALPGVVVVSPDRHPDDRGFFARTWCAREFAAAGPPSDPRPVQRLVERAQAHAAGHALGGATGAREQARPLYQGSHLRRGRGPSA